MTEEQLRALLRLKRYEQPPTGYYDKLLRDIHRRQRAELLRRPLWKIGIERLQTFFSEHSMSPASYAGAMATLLVFGVGVISLVVPGNPGATGGAGPVLAGASTVNALTVPKTSSALNLQSPLVAERRASGGSEVLQSRSASQAAQVVRHPRYVIDARPVSYEPSFSF